LRGEDDVKVAVGGESKAARAVGFFDLEGVLGDEDGTNRRDKRADVVGVRGKWAGASDGAAKYF
jgi:hypothetical protein